MGPRSPGCSRWPLAVDSGSRRPARPTTATSVSWTGGGTGGTTIAVEATAGMLQWNAYADPSATSVHFPAIPADLPVPMPASFAVVSVTKLDVPGTTAGTLARTFDRTWVQWPNLAELAPPGGSSRARILYIVGL